MVCGRGYDGRGYVLADYTIKGSPKEWSDRVVEAVQSWEYIAPLMDVVAEANQGGEMVSLLLQNAGLQYKVKLVYATKGKYIRAEPVEQMYEKGQIVHVGVFKDLEEELTNWVPGSPSPNRLDAVVWGFTHLFKLVPKKGTSGGFAYQKPNSDPTDKDIADLGLEEDELEDAPAIFKWMKGLLKPRSPELRAANVATLTKNDKIFDIEENPSHTLEFSDHDFVTWLTEGGKGVSTNPMG